MKAGAVSTYLLVTSHRVARADFNGALCFAKSGPRPVGASAAEAVRAALALGEKAARETWVLDTDLWAQEVKLHPAQVAGLTPDQLGRALAFEAEPFSGIAVAESATGFHDAGGGVFHVTQMPRAERDAIARVVTSAGGTLAGIAYSGLAPEDDEALLEWWPGQPLRIAAAPLITPPPREPSPHRFFVAGVGLAAASIVFLLLVGGWKTAQRKNYEGRNAELGAVARELEAVNKQNETLRKELATLEIQDKQREQVHARRGALLALMNALARTCGEDVVVRGLTAEGASSIVVNGLSLEAGAVDEMSIVLTQSLRAAGWSALPRSKTGRKNMASGGPWEFALVLTHEEASRAQLLQLSQRTEE
ncbi:MAG: hypothetical protein V4710_16310 [Verrucomicrobiota bacterium]